MRRRGVGTEDAGDGDNSTDEAGRSVRARVELGGAPYAPASSLSSSSSSSRQPPSVSVSSSSSSAAGGGGGAAAMDNDSGDEGELTPEERKAIETAVAAMNRVRARYSAARAAREAADLINQSSSFDEASRAAAIALTAAWAGLPPGPSASSSSSSSAASSSQLEAVSRYGLGGFGGVAPDAVRVIAGFLEMPDRAAMVSVSRHLRAALTSSPAGISPTERFEIGLAWTSRNPRSKRRLFPLLHQLYHTLAEQDVSRGAGAPRRFKLREGIALPAALRIQRARNYDASVPGSGFHVLHGDEILLLRDLLLLIGPHLRVLDLSGLWLCGSSGNDHPLRVLCDVFEMPVYSPVVPGREYIKGLTHFGITDWGPQPDGYSGILLKAVVATNPNLQHLTFHRVRNYADDGPPNQSITTVHVTDPNIKLYDLMWAVCINFAPAVTTLGIHMAACARIGFEYERETERVREPMDRDMRLFARLRQHMRRMRHIEIIYFAPEGTELYALRGVQRLIRHLGMRYDLENGQPGGAREVTIPGHGRLAGDKLAAFLARDFRTEINEKLESTRAALDALDASDPYSDAHMEIRTRLVRMMLHDDGEIEASLRPPSPDAEQPWGPV